MGIENDIWPVPGHTWSRKAALSRIPVAAIPVLFFLATSRLEAEEPPPPRAVSSPTISVWDSLFRGSVGGGFRDNVSRTAIAPESSSFIHSGAEASFIRLSQTGTQFSLFLFGEDWRYLDSSDVPSEQLASASAQALWLLDEHQELSAELQYIYQNQVVDLSETDIDLRRLLVEGHSITARPRYRWNFNSAWALQLEGIGSRQLFSNEEVDDSWEAAGRVSLVHKYGHRSELSLYFQNAHRFFDNWGQYDAAGSAISNSSLVFWRPETGAQLRHFWDKKRHWRTLTRLSYLWNRDNGPGYFDYGRVLFYQQLRWSDARWEIRATARTGHYAYNLQRVAGEKRERTYLIADLRLERRIGKHLFVYGVAEREWNFSNDPLDQYRDWSASGGVGVEF
jgi:hypothetical protein